MNCSYMIVIYFILLMFDILVNTVLIRNIWSNELGSFVLTLWRSNIMKTNFA